MFFIYSFIFVLGRGFIVVYGGLSVLFVPHNNRSVLRKTTKPSRA